MEWKLAKPIPFCLIFVVLLIGASLPFSSATGTEYPAPYVQGEGPVIDGTINFEEWSGITPIELIFAFNDTGNPIITVDLYAFHNGTALFIGLNITQGDNQTDSSDAFYIYFDEENDGALAGSNSNPAEDGLKLQRNGTYVDLSYNGSEWVSDAVFNSTNGPSYGATNGQTMWEFIFISCSNQKDFNVNLPSNVVERAVKIGIDIEYYDADIDTYDSCTSTSNNTESTNPTVWNILNCGAIPQEPPNEGALWTFITITMILPLAVGLYFIYYLIKKKTD
ncbi:MAG: hypothetical protein ACTSRS_20970 [Candidatus Helarchaeota archaeon]